MNTSKNKKRTENIEDIEIIHKELDKWYFTKLYHIIVVKSVSICNKSFCIHNL